MSQTFINPHCHEINKGHKTIPTKYIGNLKKTCFTKTFFCTKKYILVKIHVPIAWPLIVLAIDEVGIAH
jgi:hypothetical protein